MMAIAPLVPHFLVRGYPLYPFLCPRGCPCGLGTGLLRGGSEAGCHMRPRGGALRFFPAFCEFRPEPCVSLAQLVAAQMGIAAGAGILGFFMLCAAFALLPLSSPVGCCHRHQTVRRCAAPAHAPS